MIKDNYEKVSTAIKANSIPSKPEATLVGVTKNRTVAQIKELVACGVKDLGENRVQELMEKMPFFGEDIRWHLIGSLQKNKVKYIIGKVFLIHSVDSLSLLEEISIQSKKNAVVSCVLLETNVSGEESKHGFKPEELSEVIKKAAALPNVAVKGLMTMAPADASEAELKEIFTQTTNIFNELMKVSEKYDNISMQYLSMGMSHDFEIALQCGSNMVRVGTKLFI